MREWELQGQIVDALKLAGLDVYQTTAYRQKGPSGCDKGIPDLLVPVPGRCVYVGIEVKLPGTIKYSSPEQKLAHDSGFFVVAQSPTEALEHVLQIFTAFGCLGGRIERALSAIRKGVRHA